MMGKWRQLYEAAAAREDELYKELRKLKEIPACVMCGAQVARTPAFCEALHSPATGCLAVDGAHPKPVRHIHWACSACGYEVVEQTEQQKALTNQIGYPLTAQRYYWQAQQSSCPTCRRSYSNPWGSLLGSADL